METDRRYSGEELNESGGELSIDTGDFKANRALEVEQFVLGPKKGNKKILEFIPPRWAVCIFAAFIIGVLILFIIGLASHKKPATSDEDYQSPEVIKAKTDMASYRYVTLPNGIKTLLISDKLTTVAAASLQVQVGSMSDPDNVPGLAHFLEHMLFTGSQKYKSVDKFGQTVSDNGGSYNAYTDSEKTNYHFQVSNDALEGTLDIFSRFFIDPLFDETYVQKESYAVESEFQLSLQREAWHAQYMSQKLVESGHPLGKFTCGNIDSLYTKPKELGFSVRQKLVEFFEKYYHAGMMSLVISGNYSLQALQSFAIDKFASIPNKNTPKPDFSKYGDPFKSHKGSFIPFLPIEKNSTLYIYFSTDRVLKNYKTKPAQYIAQLIEAEENGTLTDLLKTKGYITELKVDFDEGLSSSSIYVIKLTLTTKGVEKRDEVARLTFAALDLLTTRALDKNLYSRYSSISQLKFDYSDPEKTPMERVMKLASSVHDYPKEHVLSGSAVYLEYNETAIKSILEIMKPENAIFLFSDPSLGNSSSPIYQGNSVLFECKPFNSSDSFYKLNYTVQVLPQSAINLLKDKHILQYYPTLKAPSSENPYVPKNVAPSCAQKDFLTCSTSYSPTDPLFVPRLLPSTDSKIASYYLQDKSSLAPKIAAVYQFQSKTSHKTAKNSAILSLFCALLAYHSRYNMNLASEALNSADIQFTLQGVKLRFNGWTETLPTLIENTLELFTKVTTITTEADFVSQKDLLITSMKNKELDVLFKRGVQTMMNLLSRYSYSESELIAALVDVTFSDFAASVHSLLQEVSVTTLLIGDMTLEQAQALQMTTSKVIEKKFDLFTIEDEDLNCTTKVTCGDLKYKSAILRQMSIHQESKDNLLLNYYQYQPGNLSDLTILELMNQPFHARAFDTLRTQKKLGYVVASKVKALAGVPGVFVIVQGPLEYPDKLDLEVTDFMARFGEFLKTLSSGDLEALKVGYLSNLIESSRSLEDKANFFFSPFENRVSGFSDIVERIKIVKGLTKNHLIELYNKISNTVNRKLSLQIYSPVALKEINQSLLVSPQYVNGSKIEIYTNETELKGNLSYYMVETERMEKIFNTTFQY